MIITFGPKTDEILTAVLEDRRDRGDVAAAALLQLRVWKQAMHAHEYHLNVQEGRDLFARMIGANDAVQYNRNRQEYRCWQVATKRLLRHVEVEERCGFTGPAPV